MKTLVNKRNPQIRITAPEIDVHEEEQMYLIPAGDYCIPMCIDDWILVEYHEVPVSDANSVSNTQEQPEMDLEKDVESWFFNEISPKINVENTMYHYFQECAHRYYNLGIKQRKEAANENIRNGI